MTRERPQNNIMLVGIFAVCVLFLIIASLIFKFVGVWQKSRFDGHHRFTTVISDQTGNIVYLTVDPSQKESGKLIVKNASSLDDAFLTIPVGVDGVIVLSTQLESEKSPSALFQNALIKHNEFRFQLTFIDLIRLLFSSRVVPDENTHEETISLPFSDQEHQQIVRQMFFDKTIQNEDISIAIENASELQGVGGRLEDILTTMGAHVISVETALQVHEQSKIVYYHEGSYTLEKLENLLGYPVEKSEDIGISDISIIIGKDGLTNLVFRQLNE